MPTTERARTYSRLGYRGEAGKHATIPLKLCHACTILHGDSRVHSTLSETTHSGRVAHNNFPFPYCQFEDEKHTEFSKS